LVLIMTFSRTTRAGHELAVRLAQFRNELRAIGDPPSQINVERLVVRAKELGLSDEDVSRELAELRACAEASELTSQLAHGQMPDLEPLDPLPAGERCHFVCAVRFGRRRADQVGHLVLASGRLQFRGALDVSVAWAEVSGIRREGREIIASLQDSRRVLRFACQSLTEAVSGAAIAAHLARTHPASTESHYHASM
jgi:hypothetical protein